MKKKCSILKAKIGSARTKKQRGKALFKYMDECKSSARRRYGKKRRKRG